MRFLRLLFCILFIIVSGCSPNDQYDVEVTPQLEYTATMEPTRPLVIPSATQTPLPTITVLPTKIPIHLCSPLKDFSTADLIGMISNPFFPPVQGSDDPHQGVDFGVVDPALGYAVKGASVQSILAGEVVMVMRDRFPYGNAVLIETPYLQLPPQWMEEIEKLPEVNPFGINPNLTCPVGWDNAPSQSEQQSFFILYAHLDNPPMVEMGQQVICGEQIGEIGDSGNALAPHLHIEMRYGFASGLEGSMAHYDVSANEFEMSNYCRWRVSGWYRLVDPMEMIFQNP